MNTRCDTAAAKNSSRANYSAAKGRGPRKDTAPNEHDNLSTTITSQAASSNAGLSDPSVNACLFTASASEHFQGVVSNGQGLAAVAAADAFWGEGKRG